MKKRVGITIALVSLLITCILVCIGCTPEMVFSIAHVDSGSTVVQPTFCAYQGRYFQEQSGIKSITVWTVLSSPEDKKRPEFNWQGNKGEMVWNLRYKVSDTLRRSTLVLSCLTYGEVPLGYQQKVKPQPLEPEQLYIAEIWTFDMSLVLPVDLWFIIRLDGTGTPQRLEYCRSGSRSISSINRGDALKLY